MNWATHWAAHCSFSFLSTQKFTRETLVERRAFPLALFASGTKIKAVLWKFHRDVLFRHEIQTPLCNGRLWGETWSLRRIRRNISFSIHTYDLIWATASTCPKYWCRRAVDPSKRFGLVFSPCHPARVQLQKTAFN